jgi:Sulfotransferase family
MKDRQRAPVLIIGAHRSGTTATVHALELLGLQVGQHLDSHREPRPLQKLHEEYLRHVGGAWHNPTPFLESIETSEGKRNCTDYLWTNVRRDFAGIFDYRNNPRGLWLRARLKLGAAWGWKEPRTTLFAPSWLEIFPDARIVHVVRDPLAAAASIRDRELKFQAAGDPPIGNIANLDYCVHLVQTYIKAGEGLAASSNYRRVRFEDIQANPRNVLEELAHSCGLHFTKRQLTSAAGTIRPELIRSASA